MIFLSKRTAGVVFKLAPIEVDLLARIGVFKTVGRNSVGVPFDGWTDPKKLDLLKRQVSAASGW